MVSNMVRRAKQTLKQYLQAVGHLRWFRMIVALVFVLSLFIPTFMQISEARAYALTPEMKKVLGSANKNLSAKFSFDKASKKWQFNKNGVAALASNIAKQHGDDDAEGVAGALTQLAAKQVGGGGKKDTSLYSVDLPVKSEEGIAYYDNVTRLSFKMVPTFDTRDAKLIDDRIVYPFSGVGKIVYTAKSNGLKEDIVLSEYIGDTLRYGYTLELPETLEARLMDDGSIGIYSANPALFGNISFSDESDKERVMEGRKNGHKDNLVFGIPAPFIKDQKGKVGNTKYELDGKKLTVVASGLKGLAYPLAVDPSVTVTSSTDFATGNNEGNIDFSTSDQINRAGATGGTLGSWAAQTSLPAGTITAGGASGVYNGYVYVVSGTTTSGPPTVKYAQLSTTGTITGSWQDGTPFPASRTDSASFIYNGYLYAIGGVSGASEVNTTVYVKLDVNGSGSMGSWQTASTTFTNPRTKAAAVAHNGYVYLSGGSQLLNYYADVQYAPILATGDLGSWTTLSGTPLPSTRSEHYMEAYNGYMYVAGGNNGSIGNVAYARINADGTLSSWVTTTSLLTSSSNYRGRALIHNGYFYITGGLNGGNNANSVTTYAPILASGALGSWVTTTALPADTGKQVFAEYNGYLFNIGGVNAAGTAQLSVYSSKIDLAGVTESYVSETDTIETDGLMHSATVAYNGFLYMLGGVNGPGMSNTVTTVYKAALNSDGSTGAWGTTSAFATARAGASAVAYNGYMYLVGGWHDTADTSCTAAAGQYCEDVQKAAINSDGTLGAWSSAGGSYSTTGRAWLGVAAYNGYIYAFGGVYNNNSNLSPETNVGQIQSNGNITGWTTTGNLATARSDFATVQYGPYLFALGGRQVSGGMTSEVQYAVLNDSGTVSWANTSSFTNARTNLSGGVYDGYVYVTGGLYGAGTNNYNDTQYARICQTTATTDGCNGTIGTLGTWRTTKSFTTTRGGHMGTIYNGYLYVMGGCTNWGLFGACASSAALLNDLQYAKVNNGGPGNTTAWTTQAASGTAREKHGGATYNGYLYVAGGCSGGIGAGIMSCAGIGMQSDVRYASMENDGTTSTWASAGADFATSRFGLSTVAYNGYLYVLGGCSATGNGDCTTFQNDVQYAPINSNGTIGGWNTTSSFSTGRYGQSAVVHNGYMYVLGGCSAVNASASCTTFQNDIQKALICTGGNNGVGGCGATAGTVGTWSSAGSSFTTGRLYQNAVINNGYMYVLAGCSAMASGKECTTFQNDVQSIAIDSSTGSLTGSWARTNSFPSARYGSSAVAYNGHLYLVGGCVAHLNSSCSSKIDNVMFAPFGATGKIGNWTTAIQKWSTDPGRFLHAVVVSKGYMVLMNGVDASNGNITTQQTSLINAQPRTGRYSKLIAVSPTTDVAGVYYNGTLASGLSVEYKVAPSSGVFGSATPAAQGTGSEPTPLCGMGSIYYVQVTMAVDDSTGTTAGDTSGSSLSDITIYYRLSATPPPNLRLTGGKWFYSELQQPLDICKL